MQATARAIALGVPFSVNGEVMIMWIQFSIIVLLIWAYNPKIEI